MNLDIIRAKTLFTRQEGDMIPWDLALNNAIPFARDAFEGIIGDDELLRFLAMNPTIPVDNFSQSSGQWKMDYGNDFSVLKVGEKIQINNQTFKISTVTGVTITGAGKITGTPTVISNLTMETYLNIFAYCVIAMVTKTATRLLMNTILPEQTQRGDDTSYRAYDPIKKYREDSLALAAETFSHVNFILEVEPIFKPKTRY